MRPTNEQLLLAAEWLDVNEGEDNEATDCAAVASYLRELVTADEERQIARVNGVPVGKLRKKLREIA